MVLREPLGPCLGSDTVAAYVGGALSPPEVLAVDRHIDRCPTCRRHLSDVARSDQTTGVARPDPTTGAVAGGLDAVSDDQLPSGSRIARYVVTERLGVGGMGVVYRADDPELGRPIALKMVRDRARSPAENEALRARLVREAQAMARLAHPNVVRVYDLVVHDGTLFVAMELIEGSTLARWLEAAPRGWRDALRLFVGAGRGLAAAHEAGIVHRDFKPQNVLVDDAIERVCVTDFGLARASGMDDGRADPTAPRSLDDPDALARTRTGALLGTPRYMAPEQYLGEEIDARTDQFAFAVALYEALYGEPPFDGDGFEARAAAVCAGKMRAIPPRANVPNRIRRALVRAMAPARAERHPSMRAFLAELAPFVDRRRPRHRWAAAALGVVVIGLAAALLLWRETSARRRSELAAAGACASAEARLAGVWDAERKAGIERAFLATGRPYAADLWRAAARSIDTYTTAWSELHRETCAIGTTAAGTPTAFQLRRKACVEDRLVELRALTEILGRTDASLVDHAASAAQSLTPLARCDDARTMAARPPLPADPEVAARVTAIRQEILRARIAHAAFAYGEELRIAEHALLEARAIGYSPVVAEALWVKGDTLSLVESQKASEPVLREAVSVAEAAGDDRMKAVALLSLWGNVRREEKSEVADLLREQAIAAVTRLGGDEQLDEALSVGLGSSLLDQGRPEEAEPHLRKALALAEKSSGARSLKASSYLLILANSLGQQGDHEEALHIQERTLTILEGVGVRAPPAMFGHVGVGLELLELLRPKEAEPHFRIAVEIAEASLAPEISAYPRVQLGRTLSELGRHVEAVEACARSLAAQEKHAHKNFPDLVDSNLCLGRGWLGANQPARAIAPLERSLAIESPGRRHEQAEARLLLATALRALGRSPARVKALARQARDTYRTTDRPARGPRHDRDAARLDALLRELGP